MMRRNLLERRSLAALTTALLLLAFFVPVQAGEPGEVKREGQQAFEQGDFAKAYRLWRPLAEAGDIELQLQLGMLFWNGFSGELSAVASEPGVDDSLPVLQARYWFGHAAAGGSAAGHHMAGRSWCCWPASSRLSTAADPDWRRAVWHFEQAAALG